jgi:hypothetical protein
VRSAPFRPGASPINITRAAKAPLSELNTALRPHIAGHSVQPAASATNRVNSFCSEFLAAINLDFITKRRRHKGGTSLSAAFCAKLREDEEDQLAADTADKRKSAKETSHASEHRRAQDFMPSSDSRASACIRG